jgi:cytochrome P450
MGLGGEATRALDALRASTRPSQGARAVTGPPGEPVLGSLRRLRNDPLGLFVEGASLYGDLVGFRALHRRVYLAVGPDVIARIAVGNRENYRKGVSYDALRVPIGDALLTMDGRGAQARRRLLMPLFTRRWLLGEVPTIAAAVESHFDRWDRLAARGKPFNLVSEMNRLAFDVVGRVLLGAELGASMGYLEELIDGASEWVAQRTRALVPLPPVLPTARDRAYRRAEREIRAFTERLLASRRGGAGDGNDVLSRLISVRDENGAPLSDREVRDEIIGFLMAGHQTTGAALAWTWYLLGRHRDIERRLAREVEDAGDELEQLPYLGQVLDESMRLYPPGWAFTRTPIRDDELDGYPVPAGSVIVISSYAIQRSPRFWAEPERFDPGRFAPDRPSPDPYRYFPFGVGPHACIGKHLALIEAKIAMGMLMRRYRVELVSRLPVAANPAITLTPSAPIMARVERRASRPAAARLLRGQRLEGRGAVVDLVEQDGARVARRAPALEE